MRPIEIFRAGSHPESGGNVMSFSQADIESMARNYNPSLRAAPFTINHPADDQPQLGYALAAFFEGDRLKVLPKDVPVEFAARVNAGEFNRVSACFYPPSHTQNPAQGSYYLKHVGFLTPDKEPGVKGLQPAAFASDGLVKFESPWVADTYDSLRDREQALAAKEAALKQQELTEFVDGLIKQGRVLPVDKADLIAFIAASQGVIQFATGEQATETWLKNWLSRLPVQVPLERVAGGAVEFAAADSPIQVAAKAGEYVKSEAAKGRKVSATEAVNKVLGGRR